MENNSDQIENAAHQDLLTDESYNLNQYVYATQWQRFANWLIDNILIRIALIQLSATAIGTLLALVAPDFITSIADSGGEMSGALLLLGFIITYVNYIFYYTFCEKLFKGYTLGKIITGTRAIRQDGNELSFKDALLRSLSRCVPFEVFSGFSTLTWHDSWTNTMVVKSR